MQSINQLPLKGDVLITNITLKTFSHGRQHTQNTKPTEDMQLATWMKKYEEKAAIKSAVCKNYLTGDFLLQREGWTKGGMGGDEVARFNTM